MSAPGLDVVTIQPVAELAFHGLARVPSTAEAAPLARAASLHAPEYIAWARARGAPEGPADSERVLLAKLLADPRAASSASLLAVLHASTRQLRAGATRALGELGPDDVADDHVRSHLAMHPSPAIEILRADMALEASAFEPWFDQHARPHLESVASELRRGVGAARGPSWLLEGRAVLSLALGAHGRALGGQVFVGVGPPEASKIAAATQARTLIAHERTVLRAEQVLRASGASTAWSVVERVAVDLEQVLVERGVLPPEHGAWLDALSLEGLAPRDEATQAARVAALSEAPALPAHFKVGETK